MKNELHLKKVVPINATPDGFCRTIKAQYYKNGFRNFTFFEDGGSPRLACLNTAGTEIAKTVLAGYYKYGVQTLLTGDFGTTGTMILEIYGQD